MKRPALRLLSGLAAVAIAAIACRQGQPAGDPKTPPNSPLPKIEKPESDQTTTTSSPPLLSRDAG